MKVYITKYALTKGIEILDVRESTIPRMVVSLKNNHQTFFNDEWHLEKTDAVKKAEDMRSKKIRSLEKQIQRVKNLNFNQ